jgi:hypothetical protein
MDMDIEDQALLFATINLNILLMSLERGTPFEKIPLPAPWSSYQQVAVSNSHTNRKVFRQDRSTRSALEAFQCNERSKCANRPTFTSSGRFPVESAQNSPFHS